MFQRFLKPLFTAIALANHEVNLDAILKTGPCNGEIRCSTDDHREILHKASDGTPDFHFGDRNRDK